MRKIIALITLVIALTAINWSIYQKETLLAEGQVIYLELAPVDPRSLMQGDYMALRFAIASDIHNALKKSSIFKGTNQYKKSLDGLVKLSLDKNNIASFVSLKLEDNVINQQNGTMDKSIVNTISTINNKSKKSIVKMLPLKFRLRKGRIKFATNEYFFEEGTGNMLTSAKYGEFRVNEKGDLLLVALRDKKLIKLG